MTPFADELNKLPTDPAWLKKIEELAAQAARELGCMVLLVAVQEGGKLAAQVNGVPKSGPLHDIAKDPSRMLETLAYTCKVQEELLRKKGKAH